MYLYRFIFIYISFYIFSYMFYISIYKINKAGLKEKERASPGIAQHATNRGEWDSFRDAECSGMKNKSIFQLLAPHPLI